MFVVLSFIGTLPNYVVDCVHQIRCFFQGDIYLILNDLNSPFAKLCIEKYNINPSEIALIKIKKSAIAC